MDLSWRPSQTSVVVLEAEDALWRGGFAGQAEPIGSWYVVSECSTPNATLCTNIDKLSCRVEITERLSSILLNGLQVSPTTVHVLVVMPLEVSDYWRNCVMTALLDDLQVRIFFWSVAFLLY